MSLHPTTAAAQLIPADCRTGAYMVLQVVAFWLTVVTVMGAVL